MAYGDTWGGSVRFIICGHSPRINFVNEDFLRTGMVISINQSITVQQVNKQADYWMVWDEHKSSTRQEMELALKMMPPITKTQMLVRDTPLNREWMEMKEKTDRVTWFGETNKPSSHEIKLSIKCNSAEPACHLAVLLGATEIILVGVDFVGKVRANGTRFRAGPVLDNINEYLKNLILLSKVKIYKTI